MSLTQLIILQLVVFIGLIFFLRKLLISNISKATGHLQELSQDHVVKQEEINKRIEEAKREAQEITSRAKREADEMKSKTVKEANAARDTIVKEAHERAEQMVERAELACQTLRNELDRKIEERAGSLANQYILEALSDAVRHELHVSWMTESLKGGFEFEHLNIPGDIAEVVVTSAYPLTQDEKKKIKEKIEARLKRALSMKEAVDQGLIAGCVVTAGSVVIDGSLRTKIQNAGRRKK